MEKIGGDLLTAGTTISVFLITMGVLTYAIGRWENRHKHYENMFILSHFLIFLGFVGYLLVRNPLELFAVQIILGISTALNIPVRDALYTKYMKRGEEAVEWGEWESVYMIAAAVGAVFGAYVAQTFGFDALFIMMSAVGFFSFLLAFIFLRKRGR